jgi:hypothetical protein
MIECSIDHQILNVCGPQMGQLLTQGMLPGADVSSYNGYTTGLHPLAIQLYDVENACSGTRDFVYTLVHLLEDFTPRIIWYPVLLVRFYGCVSVPVYLCCRCSAPSA